MLISKSLYVAYKDYPKLAWWKYNNLDTYKKIQWLDDNDDSKLELWQDVENLVWQYFLKKEWLIRLDVFQDNQVKNPLDEEIEDIYLIKENYKSKRDRNILKTLEAIKNKEPLIYQPWFLIDDLFVRWDYLKLNKNNRYDLIEVKAKTRVRNIVKTKADLDNSFLSDISFQKYVVNKILILNWLPEIENYYYTHLNKSYKKDWEIDIRKIIVFDQVDTIKDIANSEWDIIQTNDTLISYWQIEKTIKQMKDELILSEEEFNKIHPFTWSKYIEHTWNDRLFWTIYWKWLNHKVAVSKLHSENKINLDELSLEEQELFNTKDGEWTARKYISNYLEAKRRWNDLIDTDSIRWELNKLSYPICFYDYESCCIPVPFLDNTWPYEHTVVQYSLHKLYEDWTLKHYWWVLVGIWDKSIRQIDIKDNANKVGYESEKIITWWYKDLLDEFIKDIWDDIDSSFIVWHKWFENSRNNEIWEVFPELARTFETINTNTFDLKEIFSKWYYYSHKFEWSSSIKYVLPAMVPSMSYHWMDIPDWLTAMQVLNDIIHWKVTWNDREKQITNLLLYCWQDSLAMYKIYQELCKLI